MVILPQTGCVLTDLNQPMGASHSKNGVYFAKRGVSSNTMGYDEALDFFGYITYDFHIHMALPDRRWTGHVI